MKNRPFIVAAILLLTISATSFALESPKVLILPFTVYAEKDAAYLRNEIPGVLKRQLKQEGAVILEPSTPPSKPLETMTADDFRRIGVENGADFVIWGSLTRIGQRFSMDAKIIASFDSAPPRSVFQEGDSIEALPGRVSELSKLLGREIFKREIVAQITVMGNKRIEADAIERVIKTKPGDTYSAQNLSADLKAIYAMGYFDDVRIDSQSGPDGKRIIFQIKEKPSIRDIRFTGNKVYSDEELQENINLSSGSVLNIFSLKKNVSRLETLYREKNYQNVKVDYKIVPIETDQADLEFVVEEGKKIFIQKIVFEGNRAFSDSQLKKEIKSKEKGFFSWLTSSGDLNRENIERDVDLLTSFYSNRGFIKVKVSDPKIERLEDSIQVTYKIDEGQPFKVGKIDIAGDIITTRDELFNLLNITKEDYYSREVVRNDILAMMDVYSDQGYAYADIYPKISQDTDQLVVDITYTIDKGKKVYFEKISIGGNTRTRDKVIRRVFDVQEQGVYSGVKLKQGIQSLHRLDYFEDVQVNTERGSADDRMILNIGVTEKPTGAFSFGGGYSSDESFFVMASVSQRNFLGRGQLLELRGQIGGTNDRYTLSFTEPWLFDIPLSFGFDIYNWDTEYDDYDKDSTGGRLRLGYPIWEYTRLAFRYTYEITDVTNIGEGAARSIKELAGENTTNSVTTSIRYDSRDRRFNATKGSDHSFSVEYAGFGGDIGFTKYIAETGWYFPLLWKVIGFAHGRAGYVTENSEGFLPDFEKFYLGGINSMRGFEYRGIHLEDEDGAEIGGEKFVQANFELQIPVLPETGLVGILFYDTGNVYAENDDFDLSSLRESIGYGIRWYSPVGPIRIEYGLPLDPPEGQDEGGKWEFSMGAAF